MIAASRCPACDRAATPPEARCLACRSPTHRTELDPDGRVLATTRTDPEGPWVALVELGGGARVLARAADGVEVGDRITVRPVDGGYRIATSER